MPFLTVGQARIEEDLSISIGSVAKSQDLDFDLEFQKAFRP